uniref:Uncharacterized protein n=1 Tax=Ananas comosus var. bracteatus TaxID=296719 RepID=A0A6V7NXJ6_ANACO|nr:unnamed protein product [Ananas comosus var. bracteatus]
MGTSIRSRYSGAHSVMVSYPYSSVITIASYILSLAPMLFHYTLLVVCMLSILSRSRVVLSICVSVDLVGRLLHSVSVDLVGRFSYFVSVTLLVGWTLWTLGPGNTLTLSSCVSIWLIEVRHCTPLFLALA